ncbi:MAG: PQQ-dependent sugar dehydrogenase [Thermoanaerobaculia bacterium]
MTRPRTAFRNSLLSAGISMLLATHAGADLADVDAVIMATGLSAPVAITHAGDGRLFITLQAGQIVIFENGQVRPQPFLDIRNRVGSGGERGLLSTAFHPRYAQNGFFYVDYTNLAGTTVVARYRVSADPDMALTGSEAILLEIQQPFANHNGGQLQFGPDEFLYVGMGDGGSGNDPGCRAQDGSTLLGKMLRLDVDQNAGSPPFHGIPAGNPFVGTGIEDEVWALGLRNPWRFSFDRQTGDLLIADVGQNRREEIDFQPASSSGGDNYGWKVMEGTLCLGSTSGCASPVPGCNAPQYTPPVLEYDHGGGRCAVVGGYVYRGDEILELAGHYVYGDLCAGTLWAATRGGGSWSAQVLSPAVPGLVTFGEDAAGEIYLAAGSVLYRLAGPAPAQAGILELTAASFTAQEGAAATVTVSRSGGSDGAVSVDYATADGSATAPGDYVAIAGTLTWQDGDRATKSFAVALVDDLLVEGEESLTVALSAPAGGAVLGNRATAVVVIADDDVGAEPCMASPTTLCLNGGRFRVDIAWRTLEGGTGLGQAIPLSTDAGYFWFFDVANPEVFVKVLDACVSPFDHFWVFAAGLTDVETTLTVVDTATGALRRYDKPLGEGFDPLRDTTAFDTCP